MQITLFQWAKADNTQSQKCLNLYGFVFHKYWRACPNMQSGCWGRSTGGGRMFFECSAALCPQSYIKKRDSRLPNVICWKSNDTYNLKIREVPFLKKMSSCLIFSYVPNSIYFLFGSVNICSIVELLSPLIQCTVRAGSIFELN